jgi:ubiquinone/menaquinone biosynthesis C-methylase UbiE
MDMMTAPAPPSGEAMPSLDLVLEAMMGYERSAALRAAVELDLFTRIAEGAGTASEIAERCGGSERGVRILCDFLTVNRFLTKSGDRYGLSPESGAFLNRHSPAFMGETVFFLTSDYIMGGFKDIAGAVRKGGTVSEVEGLDPNHPMWVVFAKSMAAMMTLPANLAAQALLGGSQDPMKVLDIAAGHGMFGVAVAQQNPNARIVGQDWPNVLEVAQENAQKNGVGDRYELLPGSAFDADFGTGYDIVLLPNFLHHFDVPTNETLLRKVNAALKPGGRVGICEFVPNEDRVTPPMQASFSLMMLAGTPSGDAYTSPQITSMLANSGFSSPTRHDLLPTPQTLVIAGK